MDLVKFLRLVVFAAGGTLLSVCAASAHVSEQGIVLLLPTNIYIISGCLAVISSMLVVGLLPHDRIFSLFRPLRIAFPRVNKIPNYDVIKDSISILSLAFVIALVVLGAIGTRDPLVNLLPLTIWTFWWIVIFALHAIFGNLWSWINPWSGLYNQLFKGTKNWLIIPNKIGVWPATILFIAFYIFIIADLAPDDPSRLSNVVLGYLVFTFLGMIVFGAERWLAQVECFSVLFNLAAKLSPIQINSEGHGWSIGLPGWKAMHGDKPAVSQSFFLLTMLASGSFDGVNETFWWLGQIGINPLAFPGRSAVVMASTLGMLAANLLLYGIFIISIWIGIQILRNTNASHRYSDFPKLEFKELFTALAISALPIAAVYHASHYMTSLMINGQYLIAALSDPLANGSNYLGLENYQVTTGYLNEVSSVQKIWFTQAGIVVFGHVIAVLMAHFSIAKLIIDQKKAVLFHIPIAIFMAGYTWFGLWLLAAPKGA